MALDLVAGKANLEVRALSRTVLGWRNRSLRELGEKVGCSTAKLSQLCRAGLRISPLEVVKIGAACGASDDEVELCVRVAQRATDPEMWDRINGDSWARLTWTPWDVMAEASELVIVAADVLPELVRAGTYHAALSESGAAAGELDLKWQRETLKRLGMDAKESARPGSPRRLRVQLIVPEFVLTGSIGGARVMADQLERLEELNELAGFELRVVDADAGPYFGMGMSFTMMRFVESRFDDVVLLRTLHGGDTWLESATEREPYERALVSLDAVSRTGEVSSLWLSQRALLLQDPMAGSDSGVRPRHLQLIADQAGS